MADMIDFVSNGEHVRGYLALPASGRGPGVMVVQEWWGLVPQIKRVCDRLAVEGFVSLAPDLFRHLYGLSDEALAGHGVRRCRVDCTPGFPDRVEMRDLDPGETALLLNFTHQPADNPFRASHAIFVREGAERRYESVDEVPEVRLQRRSVWSAAPETSVPPSGVTASACTVLRWPRSVASSEPSATCHA